MVITSKGQKQFFQKYIDNNIKDQTFVPKCEHSYKLASKEHFKGKLFFLRLRCVNCLQLTTKLDYDNNKYEEWKE